MDMATFLVEERERETEEKGNNICAKWCAEGEKYASEKCMERGKNKRAKSVREKGRITGKKSVLKEGGNAGKYSDGSRAE